MITLSASSVASRAKACLAKATPVPGWPLLSMGMAAAGFRSDLESLQHAVDYLTCKAKAKMSFTEEEKTFLKGIFETLWWGGQVKGFPEAAVLADHYVNGKGKNLKIDAQVYQTSVIVKDTSECIKDYVRQLIARKAAFGMMRSSDPGFLHSPLSRRVSRTSGRDLQRQGYLLNDGNLLTEQRNERLKNANNRFILVAQCAKLKDGTMHTRWSVDDRYTFEPFERADFYTNIHLSPSQVLKLPDGLSQYMTVLGVANEFAYSADWTETWNV